MSEKRWYGLCPTQLDGFTADGRPFYFRSRNGRWTLKVGQVGWVANICGWPEDGEMAASGDGDIGDPDEVDALVEKTFGPGWRRATWEERQFGETCPDCKRTYRTEGGGICTSCLAKKLRPA